MAITLVSDPILGLEDARALLGGASDPVLITLINGVSAKFLAFTGRTYINAQTAAALTEYQCGRGDALLWVKAPPIDTTQAVQVDVLDQGTTLDTYTLALGEIAVKAATGRITLLDAIFPLSTDEQNIKITYYGGWSTVPGDVVSGAVEQMRVDRARLEGLAGVQSISREGQSVSYQDAGLVKSVRDAWSKYRILTGA